MEKKKLLKIYLDALDIALANDHINYGFQVKGPDYFIDDELLSELETFIETQNDCEDLFNQVGIYFDAKSHNFPKIGELTIDEYKELIKREIRNKRELLDRT